MKYFTKDQNKQLIIVNLKTVPKQSAKNYIALTDEQLTFLQENPMASVLEIMQCALNNTSETNEYQIPTNPLDAFSLDEYKTYILSNISALSLMKSREKVSDYQFLNAQSSLLVEDGQGIYSHEDSNKIIAEYITIGSKCRNKYYEFKDQVDACTNKDSINVLNDEVIKWYESL